MLRVLADTNVYIDWLNAGLHADVLLRPNAVKYLSSVVLMELRAGAVGARDRRLLARLEQAFRKAERVLVPSGAVYEEAGDVLRLLQTRRGYNVAGQASIVADVLIAMSARSLGATVVTQNGRAFEAIRAVRPFALAVVA